ncbi:MAG TPA: hypothetical protein VI462_13580 [Acidimicrobiia bacterium]
MFDLDGFIASCDAASGEATPALAIKEQVERAVADPSGVDGALGVAACGGFRTLHRTPSLTVLQFVWPPGVQLFAHDHRMWAVIGIYGGGEDNTFYRRAASGLDKAGGKRLEVGDVTVLGDSVIHAVANPHRTYTAAIHVYGGDYFGTPRSQWDPVTHVEQPFDAEAVRRVLDDADAAASIERA